MNIEIKQYHCMNSNPTSKKSTYFSATTHAKAPQCTPPNKCLTPVSIVCFHI